MTVIDQLQFNPQGHMPAIIVDDAGGQVLTLCYLDRIALEKTLETGEVWVFRRSQNKLMKKGQTSGHTQTVKSVFIDCEGKSLVIRVDQKVAACHKGYFTCYFTQLHPETGQTEIIGQPVFNPDDVY
jgi:phosphoribosyl-AMP cyclohydrolase